MSLFDSLAGQFLQGEQGAALQSLLESQGGVSGLVEKFQSGGLGEIAQSWIASGENLPISSEQIQAVLGNETVANLASKLGVDPEQAAGTISNLLPQLVDQLTPNGQLPAGNDLLNAGLDMLKGKLFG
ncbi:YidB family protein [Chitinibacter sp. ZOR0017]|uniref:YidB family protein n=1 Tax=Chitinibacter sp. ZOR0017 TaxID=1339254 RepID=UPI000645F4F4|nr:YidB family protein [Chitinibacter sp. ZOR0017]